MNKPNNATNSFITPKTSEEWRQFHKMNKEGMAKAYSSKNEYLQNHNQLFIAGTRDFQSVLDWKKILMGNFENSNIYKHIEPVFKENKDSDYVVGHSAGGSAALQLKKKAPTTHNNDHL